jgi:hypothetical protein
MAKIPINDPKHWRNRAEEARTAADDITDPEAKRKMVRIATDYEELARRAEKRCWPRSEPNETRRVLLIHFQTSNNDESGHVQGLDLGTTLRLPQS